MPEDKARPDKRTLVLQATTRLIKHKGLQALTFEAVAAEAGLSRQLLRYYYADFDALILALCDFLAGSYRDTVVAGIVEIGEVNRLGFFLDFFFDLADGYPMPDNIEVYDALLAFAVGSEPLKDRMCGQYTMLGQVVAHELAIAHPKLDAHSCEELSFIFVSMMHAHWSFVATLGYSRKHSRLTRRAIDRLIASYALVSDPAIERPWEREP